jgi:hypothetical protein
MNTINRAAYEGDIVSRLRNWRGLHLAHGGELFEEAAAEIERLRSQPCPYVTGSVTRYCTLTPFTLTDAEVVAITAAADDYRLHPDPGGRAQHIEMRLRGLLERTQLSGETG